MSNINKFVKSIAITVCIYGISTTGSLAKNGELGVGGLNHLPVAVLYVTDPSIEAMLQMLTITGADSVCLLQDKDKDFFEKQIKEIKEIMRQNRTAIATHQAIVDSPDSTPAEKAASKAEVEKGEGYNKTMAKELARYEALLKACIENPIPDTK